MWVLGHDLLMKSKADESLEIMVWELESGRVQRQATANLALVARTMDHLDLSCWSLRPPLRLESLETFVLPCWVLHQRSLLRTEVSPIKG